MNVMALLTSARQSNVGENVRTPTKPLKERTERRSLLQRGGVKGMVVGKRGKYSRGPRARALRGVRAREGTRRAESGSARERPAR